jgi:hypothetical protein
MLGDWNWDLNLGTGGWQAGALSLESFEQCFSECPVGHWRNKWGDKKFLGAYEN